MASVTEELERLAALLREGGRGREKRKRGELVRRAAAESRADGPSIDR